MTKPPVPPCKPALCLRSHGESPICRTCACRAVRAAGATVTGTVWIHPAFASASLAWPRDVWVYLPPGYDPLAGSRYPVIYMQDGNNLFSAATAFAGREWGVDETAEWLIGARLVPPLIIVGVANTPDRVAEYTWHPDGAGDGGAASRYARFLREDLKPFIDAVYATRQDRAATGVVGSSLGGLLALYLGAHEGDTFGLVGAMSPSLWWAERRIFGDLAAIRPDLRIWLDIGTLEGDGPDEAEANVDDARRLARVLARQGYTAGVDFEYWEAPDATHDEAAWGPRAAQALRFLLGGKNGRPAY